MAMAMAGKSSSQQQQQQMDAGKYVRYTPEQVEALERVYSECPKPSSMRRQQLIRDCPILSNIEPKQIKVWFQNRRCREKQRKEASRLQTVNRKLTAMNKLLMEENDRLQKQVSQLVYENGYMRQQMHTGTVATTDTSCESVVTSGQHHQQQNPTPQHPQRDANNPAGLLAIAEETLAEFLSKATGTAVEWVQMVGMKPGPDSIGIIAVSHNCSGVAARACGLVSLEPTKVAEILKDRPSWYRDCRSLDVLNVIPTGNGGNIELIYMQTYTPTTLAQARDFWTLRYTTGLEDGSLVICERSLTPSTGGPAGPSSPGFVRAEMLPSGYLIRPCEGGGSMIYIVDHVDLDAWNVPEVLRPLYESPKILAQKMTIAALRHIRQIAQETNGEIAYGGGRQPAVLRTFSQRLSKGFNDAVNGFSDDGWSLLDGDGVDDVTIMINTSPNKLLGSHANSSIFSPIGGGILCAKASMLLQNVSPALLVRFLREHRSEWADCGVDAYSAGSLRASPYAVPGLRASSGFLGGQVILPLAHTVEHEEFLEVIRLEGQGFNHDDIVMLRDMFLLQLCSGVDENSVGACAQLVFAPIDESFADDAPLLPSGFRVIPLARRPGLQRPVARQRRTDTAQIHHRRPGVSNHPLLQITTLVHLVEQVSYSVPILQPLLVPSHPSAISQPRHVQAALLRVASRYAALYILAAAAACLVPIPSALQALHPPPTNAARQPSRIFQSPRHQRLSSVANERKPGRPPLPLPLHVASSQFLDCGIDVRYERPPLSDPTSVCDVRGPLRPSSSARSPSARSSADHAPTSRRPLSRTVPPSSTRP